MDAQRFLQIVDATPLVSIDLIIRNETNQVLLGKRVNRPAQNFWFVPGGRIRKNERVREAYARISDAELGVPLPFNEADFIGVYDHIYEDNFAGKNGINTHYVVLAYACQLKSGGVLKPDAQHEELIWWDMADLIANASVHENTKAYFR